MGEAKRKEALLARCAEEMQRWGDRPVVLEMNITHAMVFCGALQLALRHEGFAQRPSSSVCRKVVFDLASQIPDDFPALRELIKLGSHPRFDT